MVKTMKEKEEVVKKLKTELTVKQDRMEEDKTVQESRSDPESVTSSLTSSTSSSRVDVKASMEKKRKANSEASGDLEKRCAAPHNMSSVSSNGDSSGEDRASSGPTAQSISIDKTVSSVSDVTDSNRGSSSNNSGSGSGSRSTEQMSRLSVDEGKEAQPSLSSISSDAAVASEKSSQDHHSGSRQHNHKDVIFSNKKRSGRMKSPVEVTSLERSFELNYEEVFDNSNVPQLIAGTSGKIVTWNKGFLKATGLRQSHLERMTIFSLVKLDKLSNFFEMVAEALRCNNEQATPDNSGNKGNSPKKYAAMTLPCIDFPAMKKLRKKGSSDETSAGDRLHVTVSRNLGDLDIMPEPPSHIHSLMQYHSQITLMSDRDPRKTCFHCTFTNCPGTNGALGSITNDLLVSLFASTESSQKKSNSRHRRKHKRARIQEEIPSAEDASKDTQKHTEEVATKEELRKLEVDSIER
jgi:PAS domain-containing protein